MFRLRVTIPLALPGGTRFVGVGRDFRVNLGHLIDQAQRSEKLRFVRIGGLDVVPVHGCSGRNGIGQCEQARFATVSVHAPSPS